MRIEEDRCPNCSELISIYEDDCPHCNYDLLQNLEWEMRQWDFDEDGELLWDPDDGDLPADVEKALRG